jgi:hypothetical protein
MASSSIHKKLSEVLTAVGYIEKSGTNQSQGYKYVMAAQVADKVREELSKRGLSIVPATVDVIESTQTISGKQSLVTLKVTWRITDSETGEFVEFQSIGSGSDSTDKGVYKAQTGALKYGLLMGFLIPTGDDPEHEGGDRLVEAAKKIFAEDKPVAAKKAPAFDPSAIEF